MSCQMQRLVGTGLCVVLAACASGGAPGPTRSRTGGANLILESEIMQLGAQAENAYDIIERLRPTMLRSRASTFGDVRADGTQGGQSIGVVAFVDNVRVGDPTQLRTVPSLQVREIRYVSATDATQRWGTGFMSGAIVVLTKR